MGPGFQKRVHNPGPDDAPYRKAGVVSLAAKLHLFGVVESSEWRRERLLILCYHGISLRDEHEWNGELHMSQEALRGRFNLLKRGDYNVLPLGEAVRRLYDGTLPPASVALTFDDGNYDFLARAVPVLQEFGFPATIYVSTYYCQFQKPVFPPACSYLAWKGRDRGSCAPAGLAAGEAQLRVATVEQRRETVERLRVAARQARLSAREKDDILREFASRMGVDYDRMLEDRLLHLMTLDEIRQLAGTGIDVQLHSHRHNITSEVTRFNREIADNRRVLSVPLGSSEGLTHFCYPGGGYDAGMLPLLREAGIESATTCVPRLASRSDDPLLLPRFIDTMQQSETTFKAWLSGFAGLLPRSSAA